MTLLMALRAVLLGMHSRLGSFSLFPTILCLAGLAACGSSDPPQGGAAGTMSGGTANGGGSAGSTMVGGANGVGGGTAGSAGAGGGTGGVPVGGQAGAAAAGGSSGSGGASGGGSGSPCSGKAYKLCEDFESGALGALPTGWTSFMGYGPASPQDQTLTVSEFHSGKQALQSNSAQKGISRIQKDLTALGTTASKHWGRIFYKVKSPAAKNPANVLHVTFLSLLGTSENRVVDIVEQQNSNVHQWLFNNPDDQGGTMSSYDWTFDSAWHCAEWFVDVSAKTYRFFSDAKEVTEIGFAGQDNQMSDYKTIIVGATHYQSDTLSEPFVVWFDDLAIDDMQIGCD